MEKKYIIAIVLVIAVIVLFKVVFKKEEINNEVITENMTINTEETVFPEGFKDENIGFDYNLVIMEELHVK